MKAGQYKAELTIDRLVNKLLHSIEACIAMKINVLDVFKIL